MGGGPMIGRVQQSSGIARSAGFGWRAPAPASWRWMGTGAARCILASPLPYPRVLLLRQCTGVSKQARDGSCLDAAPREQLRLCTQSHHCLRVGRWIGRVGEKSALPGERLVVQDPLGPREPAVLVAHDIWPTVEDEASGVWMHHLNADRVRLHVDVGTPARVHRGDTVNDEARQRIMVQLYNRHGSFGDDGAGLCFLSASCWDSRAGQTPARFLFAVIGGGLA